MDAATRVDAAAREATMQGMLLRMRMMLREDHAMPGDAAPGDGTAPGPFAKRWIGNVFN